jgi:hypothetical protein
MSASSRAANTLLTEPIFEQAVVVQSGVRIVTFELAMHDDATPQRLNNAHRHPKPMSPPINSLHQDLVDDGVGWNWRVRFRRMSTTFDQDEFPLASETLWLAIQLRGVGCRPESVIA